MNRIYLTVLIWASFVSFNANAWIVFPGSLISAIGDSVGFNDCPKEILSSLRQDNLSVEQESKSGVGKGWLIIHGGGTISSQQKNCFTTLAGGSSGKYVVIPTAKNDQDLNQNQLNNQFRGSWGAENLSILHTRDHDLANTSKFVAPLKDATGIFIGGGRQWRLVDSYLNTDVERLIKAALNRGAVVMGSSAGASIQGSFLVRGMPGNSKHPDGNSGVMIFPGYTTGFGLLPNSAIDQHVDARGREEDLRQVISAHPELIGVGIDQNAAIIVHQNRFYVLGGNVMVWNTSSNGTLSPSSLHSGQGYDLSAKYVNFNKTTKSISDSVLEMPTQLNQQAVLQLINSENISTLPPCNGSNLRQWNNCAGAFKYPNGNAYIGEYVKGMRQGMGFIDIANKSCANNINCIGSELHARYRGEFSGDKITGSGVWVVDDGEQYVGEFQMNLPNGKGTLTKGSDIFKGQFKDGKYLSP